MHAPILCRDSVGPSQGPHPRVGPKRNSDSCPCAQKLVSVQSTHQIPSAHPIHLRPCPPLPWFQGAFRIIRAYNFLSRGWITHHRQHRREHGWLALILPKTWRTLKIYKIFKKMSENEITCENFSDEYFD